MISVLLATIPLDLVRLAAVLATALSVLTTVAAILITEPGRPPSRPAPGPAPADRSTTD